MSIAFVNQPGTLVAVLGGDVAYRDFDAYMEIFAETCELTDTDLVLEMSGLRAIDAASVGLLGALHERLAAEGRRVTVYSPSPETRSLLESLNLHRVLPIVDTPLAGRAA